MQPLTDDIPPGNSNPYGYIKLARSPELTELLRDPNAWTLFTTIAARARWRSAGLGVDDVQLGEALIGDFRSAGMTRGEYREATKRLHKYRLATFRTTNRGTFGKLTNTKVFDLNMGANPPPDNQPSDQRTANEQPAGDQRTANEQPVTKKESRETRKANKKETRSPNEIERQVEAIYEVYPRKVNTAEGKQAIRKALRETPFDFLLERTRLYAQSRIGNPKHPQYTPHAARFFNNRVYDDDPKAWVETANGSNGHNGLRAGQFPETFSHLLPANLDPVSTDRNSPGYSN
jgi:hypothetical protein